MTTPPDPARPRLFQYWNTPIRPAEVDTLMRGWENDATFDYRAYDRDAALALISDRFDRRILSAFERARAPAMQADLFRLCALAAYGGIYIDADIENIGTNDFLIHREGRGFLFHRRGNLANDVMVVHEPGDPLTAYALKCVVENIERARGPNVWAISGPGILTKAYNTLGETDPLFAGFRFGVVEDVRTKVRFQWELDYKKTDADWRNIAVADLIAPAP